MSNPKSENKIDISLVPIKQLLDEVKTRCDTFVYVYDLPDDTKAYFPGHFGRLDNRVFLSTMLNHIIIRSGFEDNPE